MDEIKNILGEEINDMDYIHDVAMTKRFFEYWSMEPNFRKKFIENPAKTLAAYKLDVDSEAMKMLAIHEDAVRAAKLPQEKVPLAVRRYRAFINEKLKWRQRLAESDCAPQNKAMREWRRRQVNRCWLELGSRNASIIHTPLTFELTDGCSVGCPFCGVAAKKLRGIFHYTEENGRLWRAVLEKAKAILGDAAGTGTCYYASEPFDNTEYEQFADDYFAIMGTVPQITTAAAIRKPERTKAYLASAAKKQRHIHRFSVLSLEIFHKIMDYFTAEELLLVELLPQFTEAPASIFANVGRARGFDKKGEDLGGDTIACITGFVVNMAARTIRLITPCAADDAHPTGEIFLAVRKFSDAADFAHVLEELITEFMAEEFPRNMSLYLRKSIRLEPYEKGIAIMGGGKTKVELCENDDISAASYRAIGELLRVGGRTRYEIASVAYEQYDIQPAITLFILNKLIEAGLCREPYEL
jgi:radical SAM family RiPP maturation amino acid epimerase